MHGSIFSIYNVVFINSLLYVCNDHFSFLIVLIIDDMQCAACLLLNGMLFVVVCVNIFIYFKNEYNTLSLMYQ